MTNATSMLEMARRAVEVARKHGAAEAAAFSNVSREVSFGWRDGNPERISEATTQGLSLSVYVEGRYAAVSTSDLRATALESLAVQAIDMARALAEDPYRKLPDPKLYQGRAQLDLDLEDKTYDSLTSDARRDFACAMERAARGVEGNGNIVSVTTSFSDTLTEIAGVSSNGFEGIHVSTAFCPAAEVSVKDPDGRRPEDYDFAYTRHQSDLPDIESIGTNAAKRALGRIGAVKGKSGIYTIAIASRASGSFLGRLMAPLSGSSLQQKRSMFEGKEGQVIGSPLLDITDDPLKVRGLGSRLFDGEGIASKPRSIFEKGVLKNFFIDTYYARKLGREPTTGGSSNIIVTPGAKSQEELLKDIGDGLLVTDFLGGNSNGTTGDFSLGIQGNIIRGGVIAEPFAEMNISGNHLEFWKRLVAVGNDPYRWSSRQVPTLVFEGVQVAGL